MSLTAEMLVLLVRCGGGEAHQSVPKFAIGYLGERKNVELD